MEKLFRDLSCRFGEYRCNKKTTLNFIFNVTRVDGMTDDNQNDHEPEELVTCDCCDKKFIFIDKPANAFVGCIEGENNKAEAGEVVLCKKCYYFGLMGHNRFRAWLFSYPMAYRAKYIPPGPGISPQYIGGGFPPNKLRDFADELAVRTAFAKALDMDVDDIPVIESYVSRWL
jgi:hypothetical protein